MASRAELKARVTLDASPFRRGLARIRMSAKTLARDVGPSMRQFSGAVVAGAKAIMAAGAALAGAGVAKNFQLESLQVQFKTLLGSAEAARDRMAQLVDFSASTPFGLDEVARANKALEAAGQGSMETTRQIGDAAAATGTNFVELAGIMQKAFAMNAAGVALGDVINQLNERALLSADAFAKLRAESAKGLSTPETMRIILAELEKFEGSMEDLSKTGAGTWSTLKDNIGLALAEITAGLAEASKVGMQGLIDKIGELRKNGTLKEWGREISGTVAGVVGAFRNLSDEQLAAFKRMALAGVGFVAAWKAGLVQPLLQITAALSARIIALLSPQLLLGGLIGLGAFVGGLSIGKTLERQFNLSGLLLKAAEFAKAMAKMMVVLVANMANPFLKFAKTVSEFFTTGSVSDATADALLDSVNPLAVVQRLREAGDDIGGAMRQAFADIDAAADDEKPEKGFFADLLDQIQQDFGAIPDKIRELVRGLQDKLGNALGIEITADALAQFAEDFKRLKQQHLDKPAGDPMKAVGEGAAGAAAQVRQLKNLLAGFRGGLIRNTAEGAATPGMRAAAAAKATPGAAIFAAVKNRLAGGPGRQPIAAAVRPAMQRSTDRMADKLLAVAQQGVQHLGNIDRKGVIMGWT